MRQLKRINYTLVMILFSLVLASCSSEDKFQEGTHYQTFENAIDDQIESLPEIEGASLIEFFSYGCSHCRHFAPLLDKWGSKNPGKRITYVPVIWGEETELYANVFYLIQSSPDFQKIHHELFDKVSTFSRTDTQNDKKIALISFLQEKGIQPMDAVNAINNNSMKVKTASALMLAKRFEVNATPNLVVNGLHKLDNRSVKSLEELLEVASELAGK